MPSFILRRIFSLVFVLLFAVTATFCLLRLAPGNPFSLNEKQSSPETRRQMERKFNLEELRDEGREPEPGHEESRPAGADVPNRRDHEGQQEDEDVGPEGPAS